MVTLSVNGALLHSFTYIPMQKHRRQQDLNLRAETASDFKSDPLTTRAQRLMLSVC